MADKIIVIRGEANWAKITGKARPYTGNPAYDKGPYWSIDITPDEASRKAIRAAGISKKLREPSDKDFRKETYLTLTQQLKKKDGTDNDPPKIKSIDGRDWDDSNIGNGSVVDVKLKVVDYGTTKGVYLQATRVLKHVPYESEDFAPLSEDDAFFAGGATGSENLAAALLEKDLDYDDDDSIPF